MQPLIGWLLDLNWDGVVQQGVRVYQESNYQYALASLLVVNLIALAALFMMRETHCQQVMADADQSGQ